MLDFFLNAYKDVSFAQIILEFTAFACGIWSVLLAKKENIWVYPVGLIATLITVYLLFMAGYLGDMIINAYFSIMSLYGWYQWTKKSSEKNNIFLISRTNFNEKMIGLGMLFVTVLVVLGIYIAFDYTIHWDNYIDIGASGLFFTAMWFMAHKKIENWTLWIIGDAIVTPIYAYRGLGILALQYLIFTILAIIAYLEWNSLLKNQPNNNPKM
jgi:nicotinamide mononucleotide transporter